MPGCPAPKAPIKSIRCGVVESGVIGIKGLLSSKLPSLDLVLIMATPGVKAISRGLFTLLIPFALIIPFQRLTGNESPPWLLSIIVGIALIAYQACRIVIEEHTLRRAAHLSGARLVPRVQGKWFANLDIPFEMIKHFETGYLGMYYSHFCDGIC